MAGAGAALDEAPVVRETRSNPRHPAEDQKQKSPSGVESPHSKGGGTHSVGSGSREESGQDDAHRRFLRAAACRQPPASINPEGPQFDGWSTIMNSREILVGQRGQTPLVPPNIPHSFKMTLVSGFVW